MTTTNGIKFSAPLGRWSASDIIERLREVAGYAEAATFYPWPHVMPVRRQLVGDIRAASRDLGLTLVIHAPFGEVLTGSIYPEARAAGVTISKQIIDLAVSLDAAHVTFHPPIHRWQREVSALAERALNAELRSLAELQQHGAEVGVEVGIENMPKLDWYLPGWIDFTEIHRVLAAVPGLGVTLDIGHVHTTDLDQVEVIRRLGARINHIHVHDNHGEVDEHLHVGDGTIKWEPICQALLELPYEGIVEVERSREVGGAAISVARLRRLLSG